VRDGHGALNQLLRNRLQLAKVLDVEAKSPTGLLNVVLRFDRVADAVPRARARQRHVERVAADHADRGESRLKRAEAVVARVEDEVGRDGALRVAVDGDAA